VRDEQLSRHLGDDDFRRCGCWPDPATYVALPDGTHCHRPYGAPDHEDSVAVARLVDGVWTVTSWQDNPSDAAFCIRQLQPTRLDNYHASFRASHGLPRWYEGAPLVLPYERVQGGHDVATCMGGLDTRVKVHQRADDVEFGQLRAIIRGSCPCEGRSPVCSPEAARTARDALLSRSGRTTGEFTRGCLLAVCHALNMGRLTHYYRDDHPADCGYCPSLARQAETLRRLCAQH
jgi:hypothetical protein